MTEHRYFYTDPLAAAWMAKRFGMRFAEWEGRSVRHASSSLPLRDHEAIVVWALGQEKPRFEVHTDSLHLLEPDLEDILYHENACWRVTQCEGDGLWVSRPEAIRALMKDGAKIIQRDGKPFFWPESKAA